MKKFLCDFIRIFFITEAIPFKGRKHWEKFFRLRDDISRAIETGDQLYQYKCIYLVVWLKIVHLLALYWIDLSEMNQYLWFDYMAWVKCGKEAYLVTILMMLLAMYFYKLLYFSKEFDYILNNQRRILLENRDRKYHWPYRYKNQNCCDFVRKCFRISNDAFQTLVIIIGQ